MNALRSARTKNVSVTKKSKKYMNVRVKATGEVVTIISVDDDGLGMLKVLDSKLHHVLYRAEDLERIPDASKWEEVRNNASIAAMQGLMAQSWHIDPKEIADIVVKCADALVSRLKQIDKVPKRDE